MTFPAICVSIDVERDYRADGRFTVRGLDDGLPSFLACLESHDIPFDLMISGEVVDRIPQDTITRFRDRVSIGCHGLRHSPGYLNRMPTSALTEELTTATQAIKARLGSLPRYFRAPNFSADGRTIRILEGLGYLVDSSVLPGRYVRRWRVFPLVDHREVGEAPYVPDRDAFPQPGTSTLLEVPVAPNRILAGGPLGLGFLHSHGPEAVVRGLSKLASPYVVFLAHSWEMVDWTSDNSVAPWVPHASSADLDPVERLVETLDGREFVNMGQIHQRESRTQPSAGPSA